MIDEIIKLERLKTLESQILSVLHHMLLLLLLKTADYWFQLVTKVMFCLELVNILIVALNISG